jgi:hypothetical protein
MYATFAFFGTLFQFHGKCKHGLPMNRTPVLALKQFLLMAHEPNFGSTIYMNTPLHYCDIVKPSSQVRDKITSFVADAVESVDSVRSGLRE